MAGNSGDMRARLLLELVNKLSGPARQAAADMRNVGAAAKSIQGAGTGSLQRDLQIAARAARSSASEMAAAAAAANRLASTGPGQTLRRDLAQAAREARRTHDALSELTRGVQRLERRGPGQALRRDLAQIAREARRADDALLGAGDKARRLGQANIGSAMQRNLASIATEAERARRAMAGVNTEAAKGARGAAGGVAPSAAHYAPAVDGGGETSVLAGGKRLLLMGGATYAAREVWRGTAGQSINFEAAMADVKKKVDLPEGRSWSEIEREIDKGALKFGRSRGEVAAMTANLGASGVAFEDLPDYIAMTIGTGVAWDVTADSASEKLMQARAGLGWNAQQLRDYGDKVNALGDASNALERDIAEMFGRASGAAAAAGVPTDTTLAGLAALNSVGVQPEIASRFFAQFSAKMAMASTDSPKKWAAAGLNNKAVTAGMRTKPFETMVTVLDQIASKANAAELAVEIFGEGWWDEAMRLQRAIPEWRRLKAILDDPAKWKGSQQAALDVELATTQNHLERLWAAATKVGDALGRWTLPVINSNADSIVGWVDGLGERASVLDAFIERLKTLRALASGEDPTGGPKDSDPSKPDEGLLGWTSRWERDAVNWLSGGASDQKYLGGLLDEFVFGREGGKDGRLMDARVQAQVDHQKNLDSEAERLGTAERLAEERAARARSGRDNLVRRGASPEYADDQVRAAEADLADKRIAADRARSARDANRQKFDTDSIEANRIHELNQRRGMFLAAKDNPTAPPWIKMPVPDLTRAKPNNNYLKADGLPAVVGGFGVSGVQAGYTEKPAPRIPTRGWRISPDEAGGFRLPPRPPAGKFGFGEHGFAPQPQVPGAPGRGAAFLDSVSMPLMTPTITDQLAASIEAGRPQVESASRGVGDSVRSALHGIDLASAGQAAMAGYAASISASGEQAVAAARSVAARVRSELSVSGPAGEPSPRRRIGGALHDVPTGGP